jgi:hypothetical protein
MDTAYTLDSKSINKPDKVITFQNKIVFINNDSLYQFNLRSNKKRMAFNTTVSQFTKDKDNLYVVSKRGDEINKVSKKLGIIRK